MKRDWRALGHQKPGRKAGVAHGRPYRVRDREESREKTELMVHLRVEERLTLEEIGEIFGVSREAVRLRLAGAEVDEATREKLRTGWIKERRRGTASRGGMWWRSWSTVQARFAGSVFESGCRSGGRRCIRIS